MSLPSLRIDNFSESLVRKTTGVRKKRPLPLRLKPEHSVCGTSSIKTLPRKRSSAPATFAFSAGYTSVKLYFMLGLPTETMEDVEGIADTAQRIVDLYYKKRKQTQGPRRAGLHQRGVFCAEAYDAVPVRGPEYRG